MLLHIVHIKAREYIFTNLYSLIWTIKMCSKNSIVNKFQKVNSKILAKSNFIFDRYARVCLNKRAAAQSRHRCLNSLYFCRTSGILRATRSSRRKRRDVRRQSRRNSGLLFLLTKLNRVTALAYHNRNGHQNSRSQK